MCKALGSIPCTAKEKGKEKKKEEEEEGEGVGETTMKDLSRYLLF
jgi:hypothetical protein